MNHALRLNRGRFSGGRFAAGRFAYAGAALARIVVAAAGVAPVAVALDYNSAVSSAWPATSYDTGNYEVSGDDTDSIASVVRQYNLNGAGWVATAYTTELDEGDALAVRVLVMSTNGLTRIFDMGEQTIPAAPVPLQIVSFAVGEQSYTGNVPVLTEVDGGAFPYTVDIVAVTADAAAPSAAQVRAGTDAADTAAAVIFQQAITLSGSELTGAIPDGLDGLFDFYATVSDGSSQWGDVALVEDVALLTTFPGITLAMTGTDGANTTLTFDRSLHFLDGHYMPEIADFVLKFDGVVQTITAVDFAPDDTTTSTFDRDDTKFIVSHAAVATNAVAVTLDYTGTALRDQKGNLVQPFTALAVINDLGGTGEPPVDPEEPTGPVVYDNLDSYVNGTSWNSLPNFTFSGFSGSGATIVDGVLAPAAANSSQLATYSGATAIGNDQKIKVKIADIGDNTGGISQFNLFLRYTSNSSCFKLYVAPDGLILYRGSTMISNLRNWESIILASTDTIELRIVGETLSVLKNDVVVYSIEETDTTIVSGTARLQIGNATAAVPISIDEYTFDNAA